MLAKAPDMITFQQHLHTCYLLSTWYLREAPHPRTSNARDAPTVFYQRLHTGQAITPYDMHVHNHAARHACYHVMARVSRCMRFPTWGS